MPNILRREFIAGSAAAAVLAASPAIAVSGSVDVQKLRAIIAGPQRQDTDRARDKFRHPLETLEFLGVTDRSTVVEIAPGGGWWTAILGPYLIHTGHYFIAIPALPADASPKAAQARQAFLAKLHADPKDYGDVQVTDLATATLPPNSVDFILTFRNLHNWMEDGTADQKLAGFYRTLKPGGIFGIEDHRGDPNRPQDPAAKSGYVREDAARQIIEKAGFKFAARSDLYANPRDTKDYAEGVWTLPPTYALKDKDRAKYEAIGEADGFLMKFAKPA